MSATNDRPTTMDELPHVIFENKIEPLETEGLRHRLPWSDHDIPGLHEVKELLEGDDASCLGEEEDGGGCPLPSTPEDDHLLDCEVFFHFLIFYFKKTLNFI